MLKWIKLTKNQYFGFFAIGLLLVVLQELPYIVMPLIPLQSNPLMEMSDKSALLNLAEKTLGVSCILLTVFLVRADSKWFSLESKREKLCFGIAMLALAVYYGGWIFYFSGIQSLPLMLGLLVLMPPIYYAFIGL